MSWNFLVEEVILLYVEENIVLGKGIRRFINIYGL